MLYRTLGKTNESVSILGLGCMRLPTLDEDHTHIDEEMAIRIVHHAIDHGINYIDTAYPYHGGKSEPFLARALRRGYRKRVHLATKMPSWLINSRQDMDDYLDEQLERLDTDHIDFYLIHTLNHDYWPKLTEIGLFDFLNQARQDGRIRYTGFSFHDEVGLFKQIVDAYPWDICQIQYNYLDTDYQAGREGLLYASQRGLGIVIMEPLRGGCLAEMVPDDVRQVWNKNQTKRSPAGWGLQFLWDQPQISTVLSGMSTLDQLQENLETAEHGHPNSLSEQERSLITEVSELYRTKLKVNCTGCHYCLPCPTGVNIPLIFKYLNNAMMFNNLQKARKMYADHVGDDRKASNCIDCGRCAEHCPQDIPIPEMLEETVRLLENNNI
ncbi:MAG: aldo/keto reductase [Methanosarcinaceae archaeon]|nr:aldo/keto reductase [Methanosarcinaceae archaeon]